jgi:hypothetical protein
MTTPYSVTTSKGSVSYNNYVNAPIVGPLSTNQYPCAIPYHSYGTLTGKTPNPLLFYPSQEPVYAEMMSNSRQEYLRAATKRQDIDSPNIRKGLDKYIQQGVLGGGIESSGLLNPSPPTMFHSSSTQRQHSVSTHMNYIQPIPSSMYVNILKRTAVGKSGFKVGLPLSEATTTKNYYPSGTRTTLRRVRSGGCVAPAKKGSIYNYSLSNGQVCAWGSLVRQNY